MEAKMSRELLVVLVGATLLIATIYIVRYLCRKWKTPIKTWRIVGAVIAALGMSLILLLVMGAPWNDILFFSLACASVTGGYLWLRNKFLV
jgi:hypothetical protein